MESFRGSGGSILLGVKPYPQTRDSGIEWLGRVPMHWEVAALRHRYEQCLGKMLDAKLITGQYSVPYLRNVDVQWDRINVSALPQIDIRPHEIERYTVRPGDLLVCEGGEVGRCAIWDGALDVCGYQKALHRLRPGLPERDRPRFLLYALRSAADGGAFDDGQESTIGHLTGEKLRAHRFAFPPLSEQAAIVRFLDHADRRIRRYIRAKQKLVALLEEQKQAILHEAVTGQIDVRTGRRYPAYKDSGVAWLEKLPAHWGFRRLKSLVKRIDQGVSPQAENYAAENGSWGVLKAGCVNRGEFRDSEHKRLPSDFVFDPALTVRIGDVLVSRASGSARFVGSVGRVSALKYRLILSDKTFRPVFTDEADPDFMVLAMNGPYYRQQVGRAISGAEGLANNLPLSSLRAFRLAIPAIDEQREVVRYVTTIRDDKLGRALKRAQREAVLVREYRARLIADVVTGKLDVRAAAARLPEVDLLDAEVDDDFNRHPGSDATGAAEESGPLPDVVDAKRSGAVAGELMAEGR